MVVNRHGQRFFRAVLADDVLVQFFRNLGWLGIAGPLLRVFFRQNVVAERNTLVADEDAWAADQFADLAASLAAERTVKVIHSGFGEAAWASDRDFCTAYGS